MDRAVTAGVEMRQTLTTFNRAESAAGWPMLENGIGIPSGSVIAGNVGGKECIEYTVMGDAANLAARLEDITKEVGYPILLSDETYQALAEVPYVSARPLNDVRIKGKQESVTVYPLAG
jgi:class 3 adenylate cyclase